MDNDILAQFESKLKAFRPKPSVRREGKVLANSDCLLSIGYLNDAGFGEVLTTEDNYQAMVLSASDEEVKAIVLDDPVRFPVNSTVIASGKSLSVPVAPQLLGRVIDPFGRPIDGLGPIKSVQELSIEQPAPGIVDREPVNQPLQTGITAIDALVPIGRGQRELIIGDRQTGKTALVLDTIIIQHQSDSGVISIYCAIGQKMNRISKIVETLKTHRSLKNTIIVASSANSLPSWQFVAPFAACAIGEYFMRQGRDVLVIYDDLTRHAWAYREISLLMKRPPGREAYPGDIFYLHSRLLERSAKLNQKLKGGSLTALPIIETQASDISSYIPTNVISITDGQIFLETDLFYSGIRPAINVGLSVSRVGSKAQTAAMKQIAAQLRLELAQARELAAFAQFSSDLDETTRQRIERGKVLTEILKQDDQAPRRLEEQITLLLTATRGYLDKIKLDELHTQAESFIDYLKAQTPKLYQHFATGQKLTDADFELFDNMADRFFNQQIN